MSQRLSIISIILITYAINGVAGTYTFGGGCASQGAWTQSALSQTETILKVAESLRDNPNCKGIEAIVPKLKEAQEALKLDENESLRADRLESIPNEISALRSFAIASPELKNQVMTLLTHRTVEGASLTAEMASGALGAAGTTVAAGPQAMALATALQTIGSRVRRATVVGLDALDQAFTILPSYQECIMGAPDQGLALISAMVKLSASYTSSQEAVASRMGRTLSNLVTFLRTSRFSSALRQLNETEFWMSTSCLLETATQTFCSTRDARKVLDYGIRELRPELTSDRNVSISNPLEGFYVLTRDIPKVAEWLQKIQFGIVPKLSTDAQFKNRVLDNVNDLLKEINNIRGLYKETLLTYSILPDMNSKQNSVLGLVGQLLGKVGGRGEFGGGNAPEVNFWSMSVTSEMLPFYLIGMNTMPEECRPKQLDNGFVTEGMSWRDWMFNGGKFQPIFKDPDALTRTIELQLEKLIDSALEKASLYYQQRMIVDSANLVNESVTSQTYTVVQSLQRTHNYLGNLIKRISENNGDPLLIPSIRDTMKRISRVLAQYEEVRKIAIEIPPAGSPDSAEEEYDSKVKNSYKKIIETAYDEFNVLFQRDTFLSTRLSTFIHYDYALRVKNNENLSRYEKELLVESGKDLLGRILGVAGVNPTAALNDLNSAMVVNKRNLEALEMLFKDSLYPVIEELRAVTLNRATDRSLTTRSLYRMYRDTYFGAPTPEEKTWFGTSLGYTWAFATAGTVPWVRRYLHPDLYPFKISLYPTTRGADDEFGSFDQFKARLCIQTLAFNNRSFFYDVCKDSILKSAFTKTDATPASRGIPLDSNYNTYMTPQRAKEPVSADSICAFQTYARRNLVYWMTLDLDQNR